jgi:hypothetical protein
MNKKKWFIYDQKTAKTASYAFSRKWAARLVLADLHVLWPDRYSLGQVFFDKGVIWKTEPEIGNSSQLYKTRNIWPRTDKLNVRNADFPDVEPSKTSKKFG